MTRTERQIDKLHTAIDQIAEDARVEVIEQILTYLRTAGHEAAAQDLDDNWTYER